MATHLLIFFYLNVMYQGPVYDSLEQCNAAGEAWRVAAASKFDKNMPRPPSFVCIPT